MMEGDDEFGATTGEDDWRGSTRAVAAIGSVDEAEGTGGFAAVVDRLFPMLLHAIP